MKVPLSIENRFNYARANEIFQLIIQLYDRIRYNSDETSQKLGFTMSGWHRLWTQNRDQIKNLCKTDHILVAELESNVVETKTSKQRKARRDPVLVAEYLNDIIEIIRRLPPDHREIIMLKARKAPAKRLQPLFPHLSFHQINKIYLDFLIGIHTTAAFDYLRFLKPKRQSRKLLKQISKKRHSA